MSTNQLYLITDAGDSRVVIVCAVGCEPKALQREHGDDTRIEATPGGWDVCDGEARVAYRVYDAVDGREAMEQLLAAGLDVQVRLDYFMRETSENTHLST